MYTSTILALLFKSNMIVYIITNKYQTYVVCHVQSHTRGFNSSGFFSSTRPPRRFRNVCERPVWGKTLNCEPPERSRNQEFLQHGHSILAFLGGSILVSGKISIMKLGLQFFLWIPQMVISYCHIFFHIFLWCAIAPYALVGTVERLVLAWLEPVLT